MVVGLFMGCGSLFSWNGRHTVDVRPLTPGEPLSYTLTPDRKRRYTISVQAVFDRESAEGGNVGIKMPIVARIVTAGGAPIAQTTGWLDPEQAPTLVFGAEAPEKGASRGLSEGPKKVVAERLIGSFPTSSLDPVRVEVDLGVDRIGKAPLEAARLVVYDDAMPSSIWSMFALAGVGATALVAGAALLLASFFRPRARRGGIRRK